MIVLIPLGGTGQRFRENGYKNPKALINVFSKPIFYWLLDNLRINENINFIYVPYNPEYIEYRLEDRLRKDYPEIRFRFLQLKENTKGAAETIKRALDELENDNIKDQPIISLDSDNFYEIDILKLWGGENKLFTFYDDSSDPIYSYVKCNKNGIITDIVEKNKISDYACTGAYGFKSYFELNKYCKYVISNDIMQKNEYYLSNAIKSMIEDSIIFKKEVIPKEKYICLGTPFQLRMFYHNNIPKLKYEDPIRICFDLDGTLVSFPQKKDDYSTVLPIERNIKFLRYLKKNGHVIIIHTARRMKTHGGNIGKVNAEIAVITFETLKKYDIPFDEIYFGKPNANFYIDDLAISCYDDLEKQMGYYDSLIEPREFNILEQTSLDIFIKKSNNLSNEIYYYNNIPVIISHLFPKMIDYDQKNNKWIKMEKINGIPVSKLYLSELLTQNDLVKILDSIKYIHDCIVNPEKNVQMYSSYEMKLTERYNSYDYSIHPKSKETYKYLYTRLKNYEETNSGRMGVIHGDPVFTNIIICENKEIKFIDMRGYQGDELTIFGDMMYDWAKIYQSLIGYDEILDNKRINSPYKESMINTFKKYFTENVSNDMSNLKTITKSLLFTLIPLHDNDKCGDYFSLINSHYLS
jgi:capsule biosynthesis phosphatase